MEEGESVRGGRIWHHRVEGDVVCVGEHQSGGRGGKFERGDGCIELEAEDWFVGAQVPPPVVESVLGGDSIYELPLDSLYRAILASSHNGVRVEEPDNALDRLPMGKIFALGCKKTWVSVRTV